MKSFFKKLAFVMALAMVVTLAAPAAANAATALAAAHQISKEVVTELEMEVDDEVDLCFLGAQGGKAVWGKLNRGWKVTSGDAVTVDQNGLVKAVKNGEATIEFFMEGYTSAVVDITVGAEEEVVTDVYAGYDVTGVKEVTLKFNVNVDSVKEADVELYRVFDSVDGEVEVFWPIDGFSAKDGKIVVSPFVQFKDGDHYRIKYNGANYDFVAEIPEITEITHVVTTFGTNAAANDNKAPQSDIEADYEEWSTIKLGFKLMYGNMDVTALYKNDVEVEYALVSPDEDTEDLDEILDFDEDGELVIFTTDTVVVKAVATYEIEVDDEDVEKDIPSPGVEINPTAIIPFDYDKVVDYTFYTGTGDFSWDVDTVPAGEEGYYVVLKIQDTRGGEYVTDTAAYNAIKTANSQSTIKDFNASDLDTAGYSFKFYSTNTDTFLINEGVVKNPEVKTYKAAEQAVFYVELHKEGLNEDDPDDTLVDTVYAGVFEIGAPKTFTSINLSKTSVELMAMANENELTTTQIVGTPKHQYNNGTWTPEAGSTFKFNYEVKCDNTKVGNKGVIDTYSVGADGVITITINAEDIYEQAGKDGNFKFTIKEKTSGISESFTVSVREPKLKDLDGDGDLDIVIDSKNDFAKIKIQTTGNQMAWIDGGDLLTGLEQTKYAKVELLKTSGGYAVDHHDITEGTGADQYTWVQSADWKDATGTYVEGSRIVALLKDGKIVKAEDNGLYKVTFNPSVLKDPKKPQDGTQVFNGFTVQLAVKDETTGGMVYAEAGTYTVAVYTVSRIKDNKVYKTDDVTATFRYTDNLKDVKLVDRVAVKTTLDINDSSNWSEIVADSFKFTLGGTEWKLHEDDGELIVVLDPVIEGNHIIFKNILVGIPVDYKTNLDGDQSYYVQPIAINMSVEYVAE